MKKKRKRARNKKRKYKKMGLWCQCYYCMKSIERKRSNSLRPQIRSKIDDRNIAGFNANN